MPNLITRYAKKIGSGVKAYVKEAATSQGQIKAIDKRQATDNEVNRQRKEAAQADMRKRYYTGK